LYTTLALPVLLYGSEIWTVKWKHKSRLTAQEIRYMWKTAKYTWSDHKSNEELLNELTLTSILDKLQVMKVTGYNM
jgi:hypothetical protein